MSHRPDILPHMTPVGAGLPISNEPPAEFFDKDITTIEDIGEPTNACFFPRSPINPTHWYIPIVSFWGSLLY